MSQNDQLHIDAIVALGEDLIIDLESNPTTGYTWHLDDPKYVELTKTEFIPRRGNGTLGRGGEQVFTLKGKQTGVETLLFSYKREWEGADKAVRTYQVTVRVEE